MIKNNYINRKSLLTGASLIALGLLYSGIAHAHDLDTTSVSTCNSTTTATCFGHDGTTPVTAPADIATYCLNNGALYVPAGASRAANGDARGQYCEYTCSVRTIVPHTHETFSTGGGGGEGGGSASDSNGDGRGDNTHGQGPDAPGNDGAGGGGGKVLCTYFYRKGEISQESYYIGFVYGMKHAHAATLRGYHYWAVPYASYLYKNPNSFLEKMIRPIVLHRSEEIAYIMGMNKKPNYLGKLIRLILEPVSFTIGLFVEETDYSKLYTKEERIILMNQFKEYEVKQKYIKQMAGTPLASFTA